MNDREEGKGMRLLRKGKRGLIQAIFSRLGLIVLLFLLQLALPMQSAREPAAKA